MLVHYAYHYVTVAWTNIKTNSYENSLRGELNLLNFAVNTSMNHKIGDLLKNYPFHNFIFVW